MRIYDVIRKKRDGFSLTKTEIDFFITSCSKGDIPDYQLSALLMAIFIRGMTAEETADLTLAIANSGTMIDLQLPKAIDKHSTGGVGDTTTLIVAPVVAACGVPVAKMTGRGLGHTGGTVDKLESIPGLSTSLSMEQFITQVRAIGLALVSATTEIAPADKVLYSLRDVTATVDSIPLIASSIMGKKIAAGATHIVLDVKYGRGAFMSSPAQAEDLARAMVDIGRRVGRPTVALLTSMEEPLGKAIGNALEVQEALDILTGQGGSQGLQEVCLYVAAEMLKMYDDSLDHTAALQRATEALDTGRAYNKFREMVEAQGGSLSRPLPQADKSIMISSFQSGYIASIDALYLGTLAVTLGAGRMRKEDSINYGAGLKLMVQVGDFVAKGDPLMVLYGDLSMENLITDDMQAAFELTATEVLPASRILKVIR